MRHRVSYIHSAQDKDLIKTVNASTVEIAPEIRVAREDKYTVDVPQHTYILAIRIHISRPSTTPDDGDDDDDVQLSGISEFTSPFGYNYQTGIHIYAVPLAVAGPGEEAEFYKQLNNVLSSVLGFQVPAEKWVLSLNSFYFHTNEPVEVNVSQIDGFPRDWTQLDYFYENDKLVVTTLDSDSHNRIVDVEGKDDYTEVGIFSLSPKSSREDLILTGARVVMNDGDEITDKSVHKTMFHVKPRHRFLSPKAELNLRENGLHPVLTMDKLPPVPVDEDVSGCQLFSYLTLDKSVFVDPYQVPDSLQIIAHYGARDLELPEYAVDQWGSELLMEVSASDETPIELTLHSRYQMPNATKTHTDVIVDKPVVFYACDAISDSFLLKNSPFNSRKPIGGSFEKFFTEDTVFYHASDRGTSQLQIPNGSGNPAVVNFLTVGALLLGTLMVLNALYKKWKGPVVAAAKKSE